MARWLAEQAGSESAARPALSLDRREQLESQVYLWIQAEEPARAHAVADRLRELGTSDELTAELSERVEGWWAEYAPRSKD